jgi:hypothetical protein
MSRNQALSSGQFVRHKLTGKYGVSGVDPYGICGPGEFIVTFSKSGDSDAWLGDGVPLKDWEVVPKEDTPQRIRKRFAHLVAL